MNHRKVAHLPRCVSKKELVNYWGVEHRYMWRNILTDDLLEEWGYDYKKIKRLVLLPPDLTEKIYIHFKIKDLHGPNEVAYQ